jgi:hypothetical protein
LKKSLGFFSVSGESQNDTIIWEKLKEQKVMEKGKFFSHIRFEKPLLIRMDGRKGMAVISLNH